jgi:hypothetical protein
MVQTFCQCGEKNKRVGKKKSSTGMGIEILKGYSVNGWDKFGRMGKFDRIADG